MCVICTMYELGKLTTKEALSATDELVIENMYSKELEHLVDLQMDLEEKILEEQESNDKG